MDSVFLPKREEDKEFDYGNARLLITDVTKIIHDEQMAINSVSFLLMNLCSIFVLVAIRQKEAFLFSRFCTSTSCHDIITRDGFMLTPLPPQKSSLKYKYKEITTAATLAKLLNSQQKQAAPPGRYDLMTSASVEKMSGSAPGPPLLHDAWIRPWSAPAV